MNFLGVGACQHQCPDFSGFCKAETQNGLDKSAKLSNDIAGNSSGYYFRAHGLWRWYCYCAYSVFGISSANAVCNCHLSCGFVLPSLLQMQAPHLALGLVSIVLLLSFGMFGTKLGVGLQNRLSPNAVKYAIYALVLICIFKSESQVLAPKIMEMIQG